MAGTTGDMYPRAFPGRPLNMPAALFNKLVEIAHDFDFTGQGGDVVPGSRGATIVKVRNDTGSAQVQFAVLGLNGPIVSPTNNLTEFKRQVTFKGIAPATAGKFCVLIEPLADGKLGRAIVAGVVVCRLKTDADNLYDYAELIAGDATRLNNARTGSTRVLWVDPTSATERWAIVRLGDPASFVYRYFCSGSGSGSGSGNDINCCSRASPNLPTLTWTKTNAVGCFVGGLGNSGSFTDDGSHTAWTGSLHAGTCGSATFSGTMSIACATMKLSFAVSAGSFPATDPDSGVSCGPPIFGVWHVNDGAGNSCTITCVE